MDGEHLAVHHCDKRSNPEKGRDSIAIALARLCSTCVEKAPSLV